MNTTPFWLALQFLTRLPTPQIEINDSALGRSLLYYPLAGFIIGVILWVTSLLLTGQNSMLSAAIILTLWVLISGGLHLDGLADSADGWLGGAGNRERILHIMKDSRSGPAAIIAIFLVLLTKFVALSVLLSHETTFMLIMIPVLGRTSTLLLFLTTPYARQGGIGDIMSQYLPRKQAHIIWMAVIAILLLTMGLQGFITCIWIILTGYLLRKLMMNQIGGTTGDTAGATIEVTETVALISIAMLSSSAL